MDAKIFQLRLHQVCVAGEWKCICNAIYRQHRQKKIDKHSWLDLTRQDCHCRAMHHQQTHLLQCLCLQRILHYYYGNCSRVSPALDESCSNVSIFWQQQCSLFCWHVSSLRPVQFRPISHIFAICFFFFYFSESNSSKYLSLMCLLCFLVCAHIRQFHSSVNSCSLRLPLSVIPREPRRQWSATDSTDVAHNPK